MPEMVGTEALTVHLVMQLPVTQEIMVRMVILI